MCAGSQYDFWWQESFDALTSPAASGYKHRVSSPPFLFFIFPIYAVHGRKFCLTFYFPLASTTMTAHLVQLLERAKRPYSRYNRWLQRVRGRDIDLNVESVFCHTKINVKINKMK